MPSSDALLEALTGGPHRAERVLHAHAEPARDAVPAAWPEWVDPVVRERFAARGITELWSYQVAAADLAWSSRSVAVATERRPESRPRI